MQDAVSEQFTGRKPKNRSDSDRDKEATMKILAVLLVLCASAAGQQGRLGYVDCAGAPFVTVFSSSDTYTSVTIQRLRCWYPVTILPETGGIFAKIRWGNVNQEGFVNSSLLREGTPSRTSAESGIPSPMTPASVWASGQQPAEGKPGYVDCAGAPFVAVFSSSDTYTSVTLQRLRCQYAVTILPERAGEFTKIRFSKANQEGFVNSSLLREGAPPGTSARESGIPSSPVTPTKESENPSFPSQVADGNDVVQAPFGMPLVRKEAAFCQGAKHVNVFIRVRNDGTFYYDKEGNRLTSGTAYYDSDGHRQAGDVRSWPQATIYIEKIGRLLENEGYCLHIANVFDNPQILDQPWDQLWAASGAELAQLRLDPSMALSPTEVSTELEREAPYVLVNFFPLVFSGGYGEQLFMTARNRWLSLVPEITGSLLFNNGNSSTPPERLVALIDWVANRIPLVKTKLIFEGRELPAAASNCKEAAAPPEQEAALQATRLNWQKSADAACRVSSVYFDQDGSMKKCGAASGKLGR